MLHSSVGGNRLYSGSFAQSHIQNSHHKATLKRNSFPTGQVEPSPSLSRKKKGGLQAKNKSKQNDLDSQVAVLSVSVAGFWGKVNGKKAATGDPGRHLLLIPCQEEAGKARGSALSYLKIRLTGGCFSFPTQIHWLKHLK